MKKFITIFLSTIVTYFMKMLLPNIILKFLISGIMFIFIDISLAYLFGINKQERQMILMHFSKKGNSNV